MTPRLAMRPSALADHYGAIHHGSHRTLLDGVWWPRSVDPVVELPGLVVELQTQGPPDDHCPVAHIMLRSADWNVHPRRLRVQGPEDTREVLLSWFGNLSAGLLTAIYADGRRVDLLTIPASTGDAAAWAALETAARPPGPEIQVDLHDLTRPAARNVGESDEGRLRRHLLTR